MVSGTNGLSRRGNLLAGGVVFYVLIELWRFYRFRKLLTRLRVPNYVHNGGRNFLAFALSMLNAKWKPLTIDLDIFKRYAAEDSESIGYGGGQLDWRRFYSWWAWGAGRPFDIRDDPQLHADLLECASACCRATGIEEPPADATAPATLALSPCGFGINDVRATFKPLPIRAFLRMMRPLTRLTFRSLGFRQISELMPEGELVCWTDIPVNASSSRNRQARPPVVFVHGLGLGALTFVSLFIGKQTKAWRSGGCVIVEVLNLTFASHELARLPNAMHYADAIGRLMRKLGYGEYEFDVVSHSLSTYLSAIMCNEGSPCRPRRSVLIDPVCFLEGVEVCSRFPFRTPAECRQFGETTVLAPKFTPLVVRWFLGWTFRHFVCRDIFVQYLVLRWNGKDATSIFWRNSSARALVCLSDEDNFVPSSRVADHCEAHFPLVEVFRMPNADHGTFVIESAVRKKMLDRITMFLSVGDRC